MSELKTNLQEILQEKQEKIIPENIKKDVTIFDITGTYEGSGDVKLFETVEEMQADENSKEGDLAVVYRSEIQNMTVDTQVQYITFPETVTLPQAVIESYYCMLRAVDDSAMFDGNIQLSKTSFRFDGYSESGMIRVQYSSSDGITYTRTRFSGDSGDLTNPVDFGTTIQVYMPEEWNDNFGYFMQVGGNVFDGLYEYELTLGEYYKYTDSLNQYNLYDNKCIKVMSDTLNGFVLVTKTEDNNKHTINDNIPYIDAVDYTIYDSTNFNGYVLLAVGSDNQAYILCSPHSGSTTLIKKEYVDRKLVSSTNITTEEIKTYPIIVGKNFTLNPGYQLYKLNNTDIVLSLNEVALIGGYCFKYSSVLPVDDVQYNNSYSISEPIQDYKYILAKNQFNLSNSNELLPGKIAYGKKGIVTGDESVYDNLDLTLTTKYLLPSVPTDTDLVEDYKITFFDNDFVPTVTNKIQQLVRDITTNTFAQYYSDNNTEYASEPYAHTLSHNNKIYIIAHDQYSGPNLWYYRIDANTGQVEQFKKNVFDNKELDIVGDAPNKIRQTISVNDNTGDIYFLVYENSSQMKLCKADTSGAITYVYSFSVSKIYNADFLGYNEYNDCLYYIFTTDNQITKINKVSMEGQSTNIYSINDTSRLQYITSSTKSFMTVVLPSINKILVINKQTEEIKEISVTEDVYENLAAYEINDDTINISVGTKDSSYTPLKCYTIKVSTATITPIEAKHQIVPSNSVLWSDDQYLYTDGCVGDKDTGYIINYFDSIYKYDNFIVMAKNKNYNILRITCTNTAMNIEKYYPVKMQDIILGEQGILVKWINTDTLVNISDVDLLKLSGEEQSPINLDEYNTALTTTEQILREEVTENE